jgi:uncharacterized membrane protein YhaH (DUF805 family)
MNLLRLPLDFRSRINRAKFWLALVIQAMFVIVSEELIVYFEFPALSAGGLFVFTVIEMGSGIFLSPLFASLDSLAHDWKQGPVDNFSRR